MENLKYKVFTINPKPDYTPIEYEDPINPIIFPFNFIILLDYDPSTNVYIKLEDISSDEIELSKLRIIKNYKKQFTKFWIRTDDNFEIPITLILGSGFEFETISPIQSVQITDILGRPLNLMTDRYNGLQTSLMSEYIGLMNTLNEIDQKLKTDSNSNLNMNLNSETIGLINTLNNLSSILNNLNTKIANDNNGNLKTNLNSETIGLINTLNNIISTINGSNISRPSTINTAQITIDNSSGSSPLVKALFSSSTPSKRATINFPLKPLVNFSVVDQSTQNPIYIGNSSAQNKTLAPGDSLETYISDLSQVYVKVNTGQKVYIEVVWEV